MNPKDYVLRGKDYLTDMPYKDFRLKTPISEMDKILMAIPYLNPNSCQCSHCQKRLQEILGKDKSKKYI